MAWGHKLQPNGINPGCILEFSEELIFFKKKYGCPALNLQILVNYTYFKSLLENSNEQPELGTTDLLYPEASIGLSWNNFLGTIQWTGNKEWSNLLFKPRLLQGANRNTWGW